MAQFWSKTISCETNHIDRQQMPHHRINVNLPHSTPTMQYMAYVACLLVFFCRSSLSWSPLLPSWSPFRSKPPPIECWVWFGGLGACQNSAASFQPVKQKQEEQVEPWQICDNCFEQLGLRVTMYWHICNGVAGMQQGFASAGPLSATMGPRQHCRLWPRLGFPIGDRPNFKVVIASGVLICDIGCFFMLHFGQLASIVEWYYSTFESGLPAAHTFMLHNTSRGHAHPTTCKVILLACQNIWRGHKIFWCTWKFLNAKISASQREV